MIRDIITIDEEKCNGCGVCISACHEGALALVDGKARLITDSYCDGLGACMPECPTGAMSIEKREADEFSLPEGHPALSHAASAPGHATAPEKAAPAKAEGSAPAPKAPLGGGCPGSQARTLAPGGCPGSQSRTLKGAAPKAGPRAESAPASGTADLPESELMQWPVQIKLVPVNAPYFQNAKLLIAADCAAYARASFHQEFMRGRITIIGCPKLDAGSYVDKLTEIFRTNDIRSIMVARMEVPCCGGLEMAVKQALVNSGKMIPWQIVTLGTDGRIVSD